MAEQVTTLTLELQELDALNQRLEAAMATLKSLFETHSEQAAIRKELGQMMTIGETYHQFLMGLIPSDRSGLKADELRRCQTMLDSVSRFPTHVQEVRAALSTASV